MFVDEDCTLQVVIPLTIEATKGQLKGIDTDPHREQSDRKQWQ